MNLLDENFPEDQLPFLQQWRIPFRQIGHEMEAYGTADENILPVLHRQRRATFFTLDKDFFQPRLCHPSYCLVWLDVRADDAAEYLRCFLAHPRFCTVAQRMGKVARVHHDLIHFWERNLAPLQSADWPRR